MTELTSQPGLDRQRRWLAGGVVALAALAMGLPTITGGFVGGDDYQLALNHVFVNHPSWSHALKIFGIVHRDLYQPLPLLSFQAEFAVAGVFDIFDPRDPQSGAWLFHLTNICLHVVNAVLVWCVMRRLAGDPAVAVVVGLLFAVHPLQVEVVAWINGRMMLLSTLFALATLLAWQRWLATGRRSLAPLVVLLAVACAISKVRIGLPALLLIVPLAQGSWRSCLRPRCWGLWLVVALVTAGFAALNIWSTAEAEMFAGGAEHLHGSRVVRVLISLAWYVQHFVWPGGLAAWYPPPITTQWWDADTAWALGVMLLALVVTAGLVRTQRRAGLGAVWFAATIFTVLPLMPARNILAADRYMYLPLIGLAWLVAEPIVTLGRGWTQRRPGRVRPAMLVGAGAALAIGSVLLSWHVGSFYHSMVTKTERIAQFHPDMQQVWEKVAWAHFIEGKRLEALSQDADARAHFTQAITLAERELQHDDPVLQGKVLQLIGLVYDRLGDRQRAEENLAAALARDATNPLAHYRLGRLREEQGRLDEALAFYEAAAERGPTNNPVLVRLGALYLQLGRLADARRLYEQALANNDYEEPAIVGLAEIDLATGTPAAVRTAIDRLEGLLAWMPSNTVARTNLGVAYAKLGRTADAMRTYAEVLQRDPLAVTAALNLAALYRGQGAEAEAGRCFAAARRAGLRSVAEALPAHQYYVDTGQVAECVTLWQELVNWSPDDPALRAWLAWSLALAGEPVRAEVELNGPAGDLPLSRATRVYVALLNQKPQVAVPLVEAMCHNVTPEGATARQQLLRGLELLDRRRPSWAWTYCLTARLLIAHGNREAAKVFADLCKQHCRDDACRAYQQQLPLADERP